MKRMKAVSVPAGHLGLRPGSLDGRLVFVPFLLPHLCSYTLFPSGRERAEEAEVSPVGLGYRPAVCLVVEECLHRSG